MAQKYKYKEFLKKITSLFGDSQGHSFDEELIKRMNINLLPVSKFFDVKKGDALVLAFLLHEAFLGQEITPDSILNHFGNDLNSLADIYESIDTLTAKKLVFRKGVSRFRPKYSFQSVLVNPKTLQALQDNDISVLNYKPQDSFADLLLDITDLIRQRIELLICTDTLVVELNQVLQLNRSLPEVLWLYKQVNLKDIDLLIFLDVCIEFFCGEEEIDIDKIIAEIIDSVPNRMKYKQEIKRNTCSLFQNNYLVNSGGNFALLNYVSLSDESLDGVFPCLKELKTRIFDPKIGKLLKFDSLPNENLIYNSSEQKQILTLKSALTDTNYNRIRSEMADNQFKCGFTILLHGAPGTGKTSTVFSLARATQRHIILVDIPSISSKWVGESEKNISKIFTEYKRACKVFPKIPILLFNEADAILGKRISSNSSVDKMNNTMQNVLLQCLEDFEGILIATTNMAKQFDHAFERRLLAKILLSNPDFEVRKTILSNAFSDLKSEEINEINSRYSLSGGQIANLKKKLIIQRMLHGVSNEAEAILEFCEEEFSLQQGEKRNPIGFAQRA